MSERREATCRCGQLQVVCVGEPARISVCHCLNCQKRSGSAFAVQARWPDESVAISGEFRSWPVVGDSGGSATFCFCPTCGSTVFYTNENMPGVTAVAVGGFADPGFPAPRHSVWEVRKHGWVTIEGRDIDHWD